MTRADAERLAGLLRALDPTVDNLFRVRRVIDRLGAAAFSDEGLATLAFLAARDAELSHADALVAGGALAEPTPPPAPLGPLLAQSLTAGELVAVPPAPVELAAPLPRAELLRRCAGSRPSLSLVPGDRP